MIEGDGRKMRERQRMIGERQKKESDREREIEREKENSMLREFSWTKITKKYKREE